ncbi:MAG: GGDEF domain-containing protein, partial [Zoogloea sp.]|nr:GGDEF domain-containing protein [Zoogloea sp.]
ILSTPEFEQRYSHDSAHIIAIAGSGVSLLLAVLTWQLATGRARAFARAQAMTRELRESEERMRHMAQHDPLTHLPNRALFSDRLQAALARARRDSAGAGLMFVDLDHFKPVNDAYGHAVGDHLLVAATKRMRDCLRESDTLARVGGDEFVVLLPHIDTRDDARLVAERIRTSLALPFLIDNHALAISASIGIGIFPEHGSDDVTLIKSADDAMYRAKDAGRDRLVFAD